MQSLSDLTIECHTYFNNLVKCLLFNLVSGRHNMNALKQSKISLEVAQTLYLLMHQTIKAPTTYVKMRYKPKVKTHSSILDIWCSYIYRHIKSWPIKILTMSFLAMRDQKFRGRISGFLGNIWQNSLFFSKQPHKHYFIADHDVKKKLLLRGAS